MDTKSASNVSELLDEAEAAKILRISRTTLIRRRKNGEIECTRLGKKVFYTPEQVQAHIDQSAVVEGQE